MVRCIENAEGEYVVNIIFLRAQSIAVGGIGRYIMFGQVIKEIIDGIRSYIG